MDNTINGRTPEEIKKGLECCQTYPDRSCKPCPYVRLEHCLSELNANALAYIQQLEARIDILTAKAVLFDEAVAAGERMKRERDAAVETVMLLANTDCTIPCESDELECSEYCEKHCDFKTPQKECWMEYFRRRGVQEVE